METKTITNFSKPIIVGANTQACYFLDTIPQAEIQLKKNAQLTLIALVTKGWENERQFTIKTSERGAKCQCIFFILGNGNERITANIKGIHQAPNTGIKAKIRTALTGSAICHINGDWIIEKGAQGTDTHFADHTLILSEQAAAKTSPNLEIKTDTVKAGHSASVGKIDEEALFYLLSRGLTETEARTLMIQGFFETELEHIPDEKIKEKIRTTIRQFLG